MKTLSHPARRRARRRHIRIALLLVTVAVSATAALAFLAPMSETGRRVGYRMACIQSETTGPVSFQYSWGQDGPWLSAQAPTDRAIQGATCRDGFASHRFHVRDDELFLDAEEGGGGDPDRALINNRLLTKRDLT